MLQLIKFKVGALLSLILTTLVPVCAVAQTSNAWPTKPIRIIVPFGAGSFTDVAARSIGAELTAQLGQPVVVEDKGGAGSTLGTDLVAKAAPDGYTFLVTDNSFAVSSALYDKLPYNPAKDIVQVSVIAEAPAVLVGRLNLPVKTLKALVALAAQEPGKLNFGSGGQGSSAHLAMEAFLLQNQLQLTHVPFKGIAPAINDVAADRLDIAISSIGSTSAFLKDKRLIGLAISSETRHPDLPDVPTFAQAGFPNYSMTYWFGMMAPANTPADILTRMQAAVAKTVTSPKVIEVFKSAGVTATSSTSQQFAARVTKETALWRKVIQEAKIKPE